MNKPDANPNRALALARTMADRPGQTLVSDSTASEATDSDLTGRMLAHFHVESRLRSGGMGEIWEGVDVSLERSVALKVLAPELSDDPVLSERFLREARSQARLSHANVVTIYFIGEQDGRMFFAMELVPGESLADVLERGETLSAEHAVERMIGVGRALRHAHERGLIHRDVKPGNLLVEPSGHVKVADFGLARPIDGSGRLTGKGVFLGTPLYVSPEQARATDLDHRSDMYSLAATFYHLLVGKPIFDGRTPFEILAKHAADEPDLDPLRQVAPLGLLSIMSRMLAKDPEERFANHDEVVQALKRLRPPSDVIGGHQ